jgi:hypothetical protein
VLVERFHANAELEALYQQQLTALRTALLEGGAADGILAAWVGTLTAGAADLVDAATISSEAAAIAAQFDQD